MKRKRTGLLSSALALSALIFLLGGCSQSGGHAGLPLPPEAGEAVIAAGSVIRAEGAR